MVPENRSPAVFRFGTFEVDVHAGELRKQGVRVKIQEQPLQVLTLLLQRPGEVVTREELRLQIWEYRFCSRRPHWAFSRFAGGRLAFRAYQTRFVDRRVDPPLAAGTAGR
jgi:hypothetical protein